MGLPLALVRDPLQLQRFGNNSLEPRHGDSIRQAKILRRRGDEWTSA